MIQDTSKDMAHEAKKIPISNNGQEKLALTETANERLESPLLRGPRRIGEALWHLLETFIITVGSLLMLLVKTPATLLPSVAFTTAKDEEYNRQLMDNLRQTVRELDGLGQREKELVIERWIEQLEWTNGRATRERDANEMIRWWQIILGVLIPALIRFSTQVTLRAKRDGINTSRFSEIYRTLNNTPQYTHMHVQKDRYLYAIGT